jgi:hypothetical protein
MKLRLVELRRIVREEVQRCHQRGTVGIMEDNMPGTPEDGVFRLELDFADPPDSPEEEQCMVDGLLRRYGIKAKEVSESGPGGWPVWELVGSKSQLRKYLYEEYCCGEEDEVEFYLAEAEPV